MPIAIVLILLVVGSVLFHFLSPWWFTPIASNWQTMDDTVILTFWVTGAVFIAVNLFMAWAIIKYRHREGSRADYEPENSKLELILTAITAVGVAAMLAPGLAVWAKFVNVPEDADEVEVVGQQWHWSFRLPGQDGVFGKTEIKYVTLDNPFGMVPDDPAGLDDRLVASNELHLPINRPVKTLLRSKDVLHDFAVPQFRVKMDLVPGLVTYLWFTPTRTGTFEIMCEELCGLAHHTMRGKVVVDTAADYARWLGEQPTWREMRARTAGDPVAGKAMYALCAACHGPEGQGNRELNAPKLTGQAPWYLIRQLEYYRNGARGAHEQDRYGQQMAPMARALGNEAALRNIVAYISTLPDRPAVATITGDLRNGQRLYGTCGACHGRQGEGIWSMNAPRLAGMSDWYTARQLHNYKDRIRGAHPDDLYGMQMNMMARILKSDEAVYDVTAYINSLQAPQGRQN